MEIPLWLIHGIHDQVVSFNEHSQSLYATLQAMNHPNLHLTALDAITDETGCYQDDAGHRIATMIIGHGFQFIMVRLRMKPSRCFTG